MNPRSSTPQTAEDAGLGSPPRRDRLRRVGAGLLASVVIGLLTPAVAHADSGKAPEIEGFAYYVLAEPRCYVRPDGDSPRGPLSPVTGGVYEASAAAFRGPSIADGADRWRWVQEIGNPKRGCYVTESDVTSVLPSDPAEIDWVEGGGLMGAVDGAGVLGALVTRGSSELLAAPTIESEVLAEPEDGTLLDVPSDLTDWTVTGDLSFSGPRTYTPVRLAGVLAWARADSVTGIPVIEPETLTDTFTAAGDLDVASAPSPYGQIVTTLVGGETAQTGAPFAGYQPVALDTGEVGWISQEEALAAAVEDPGASATPTTEATPFGDRVDAWTDEVLGDDETEGSLIDRASAVLDEVKDSNPAAKAAARAALFTSALAGVVALLLLAVAIAARAMRKPVHAVVAAGTGLIATFVAASLAPTAFFQGQVMAGVGVLGLTLGFTVASTVASLRGVPLVGVGEVLSSTNRLFVVLTALAAPVAFSLLAEGLDWPVGALLGLPLAGAALGFLVKPDRAAAEVAAHPTVAEVATVASDPSFESGW